MLVQYSSSSSEDEPDCKKIKTERKPLILPKAIAVLGGPKIEASLPNCDKNYSGRTRSFPHERGNWATFVYISVNDIISMIGDIAVECQRALKDVVELESCTRDLHLSLSKTFVLQYHLIGSFIKSLNDAFYGIESCRISLGDLKIYVNEEHTRTFIAFAVNDVYYGRLNTLLSKVDAVLKDYKLPLFYKPASFHVSFLWCLGDKVDLLNTYLYKLNQAVEIARDSIITINVNSIRCKSGNKDFVFHLG